MADCEPSNELRAIAALIFTAHSQATGVANIVFHDNDAAADAYSKLMGRHFRDTMSLMMNNLLPETMEARYLQNILDEIAAITPD